MLLRLEGVSKQFGAVPALRDLSLSVEGGRIGLLGPNGAGKTTLLRGLLGLLSFSAGRAEVLGIDAGRRPREVRARSGFMPEGEAFVPALSGVELCAFAAELCGLPRIEAMRRAHAALDDVGLGDKRYQAVDGYSTGQKQRVKLATAMVHDPELLLLDEPTAGLDPRGREEMLALIADVGRKRQAHLLLSTHLLPDLEATCEQVILLDGGRARFVGSLDQLHGDRRRALEVRVKEGGERLAARLRQRGCTVSAPEGRGLASAGEGLVVELPEGASVELIWQAVAETGVQVRQLAPCRLTLESAFLRAVGGDHADS
jgi:ABC-2 type transport system ATP-binding protein